mgnify:FL=1
MLTMALMAPELPNPIEKAVDYYQKVDSYQTIIKSYVGSKPDSPDIVRYYYNKSGAVRMEVVEPFNGAVLIYNPVTELVKLWLFGYGSVPSFSLSPENKWIQSSSGQRVDRSDIGALYEDVMLLQHQGKTTVVGTETVEKQAALYVIVEGNPGVAVEGVSRFDLWFDVRTSLPLKVISYKADGSQIERIEMSEYQVNPIFPKGFFDH